MSKTFKSAVTAGREVLVDRRTYGVFVRVIHEDRSAGTTIAAADAPAVALAILEAAGVKLVPADSYKLGSLDQLRDAAHELRMYVNYQAEAAKEAADREALEGEAWELWKEFDCALYGGLRAESFQGLTDVAQSSAMAMARKAREMYGATS